MYEINIELPFRKSFLWKREHEGKISKNFLWWHSSKSIQPWFPLTKNYTTYALSTLPGKTPAQPKSCPCIALTLRASLPLLNDSHILLLCLKSHPLRSIFYCAVHFTLPAIMRKRVFCPAWYFCSIFPVTWNRHQKCHMDSYHSPEKF